MGVIYSSAEVATAAIPIRDAHVSAAHEVMRCVPRLVGNVLTVVHGSVPDGRANIRSDLDVLVTYRFDEPSDEPELVDTIKAMLDKISTDTNVKIEPNIWPADEPLAARKERMYDLLFSHHLAVAMQHPSWSVGETDTRITEIAAMPVNTDVLQRLMFNYLTYKHSGIVKAPRKFNEADRQAMLAFQRVLEFPKALGRKVMQLSTHSYPHAHGDYSTAFEHPDVDAELHTVMEMLRSIDRQYTELIEYVACNREDTKQEDIEDYADWLVDRYTQAMPLGMIATSGFTKFLSRILY